MDLLCQRQSVILKFWVSLLFMRGDGVVDQRLDTLSTLGSFTNGLLIRAR